ncbi:MAG: TonB family protein [Hymenobacter sp.]|nr:MAG: TonB family protein [Hymenobacter sp.]
MKGNTVYAAPGMPIMLAHRPPDRVAAKPVIEPWLSDPLPRFWKSTDSLARQLAARPLWQAVRQRVRYPQTALRSQVEGTVQVRILIAPDGAPLNVSVLKTAFMPALADRKASEELEAEALRVAQQLHFQPKAGAVDTVTIPFSYRIQ